jgi:hypothetical protein
VSESDWRNLATYDGLSGFHGAVGKITRAQHQLRALDQRLQRFAERHPYQIREEFHLRPGEEIGDYAYIIEAVGIPKVEWGVLIGELVHNLRSALDHAIYAAAEKPSRETQFPIFNSHQDWSKRSCSMLYSVPEHVVSLIEEAQPYRSPEPALHVLAVLRQLSNHDKHRLLHTAAMTVVGAAPGFGPAKDISQIHQVEMPGLGKPLRPGLKLANVVVKPDGPNPQMQLYGEFTLGIAFCHPKTGEFLFEGVYVQDILFRAFQAVRSLVVKMELACSKPEPPPIQDVSPSKG